MPTYDYQCRDCGTVTEVIHSMLEDGPSVCVRCGGSLRRILYPTGIIFKGSGFYSTDSRSSSSASNAAGSKKAPQAAGGTASSPEPGSSSPSSDTSESSSGTPAAPASTKRGSSDDG